MLLHIFCGSVSVWARFSWIFCPTAFHDNAVKDLGPKAWLGRLHFPVWLLFPGLDSSWAFRPRALVPCCLLARSSLYLVPYHVDLLTMVTWLCKVMTEVTSYQLCSSKSYVPHLRRWRSVGSMLEISCYTKLKKCN